MTPSLFLRKRDDEAESTPDIDLLTPPNNNSPLPDDPPNIRNIIDFLQPHRNLSYIIEGRCVQKIVSVLKMKGDPPPPQFFKCQSFHSNAVWNKKRDHATDDRF